MGHRNTSNFLTIMRATILIFSLLVQALTALEVHDKHRKCPSGYTYYGEVEVTDFPTRDYWVEGERTPTYSCYSRHQGPADWVSANQKCSESDGQLLSVNNYGEADILSTSQASTDLQLNNGVLTSGISLSQGSWTWFGAAEMINDTEILGMLGDVASTNTQCVWLTWQESEDGNVSLSYSSMDCLARQAFVCEVRVYTQTWYYWATANWLQILFCLTLVLLIISSCVTVSMYSSSPRSRRSRGSTDLSSSPPPYTPRDTNTTSLKTGNKYAEKGKELLAKIVFYRQSEDKQKLTPEA